MGMITLPTPSHTPGPWRYVAEVPDWCRVSMGDGIVAEITGGDSETCTANARLIAAAPELLKALSIAKDMLVQLGMPTGSNPVHPQDEQLFDCPQWREQAAKIRAAIAKAESK